VAPLPSLPFLGISSLDLGPLQTRAAFFVPCFLLQPSPDIALRRYGRLVQEEVAIASGRFPTLIDGDGTSSQIRELIASRGLLRNRGETIFPFRRNRRIKSSLSAIAVRHSYLQPTLPNIVTFLPELGPLAVASGPFFFFLLLLKRVKEPCGSRAKKKRRSCQRRSWCTPGIMSTSTGAGGSDPLGHCDLHAIH
jgi:hypothetical protein